MQPAFSLNLEICTARYLGNGPVRELITSAVAALPARFAVTKWRSSVAKAAAIGELAKVIESQMPGSSPFQGDLQLFSPKSGMEVGLYWVAGSREWLSQQVKLPFNRMFIAAGSKLVASLSEEDMSMLIGIWRGLCLGLPAVYGYVSLQSETQGANPRGDGLCLPRVHWLTYFGSEYSSVLRFDELPGSASIEVASNGTFIKRGSSPESCIEPSEAEEELKLALGPEYFWKEGDSWRSPKYPYRTPTILFPELEREA